MLKIQMGAEIVFTFEGVHISEVFSLCKRYKWDQKIVFTFEGVHISEVFSLCKRYKWDQKIVFT